MIPFHILLYHTLSYLYSQCYHYNRHFLQSNSKQRCLFTANLDANITPASKPTIRKFAKALQKSDDYYVKMENTELHWSDIAPLLNKEKDASSTDKWLTDQTIDGQLQDIVSRHDVTDSVKVVSSTSYLKWKVNVIIFIHYFYPYFFYRTLGLA